MRWKLSESDPFLRSQTFNHIKPLSSPILAGCFLWINISSAPTGTSWSQKQSVLLVEPFSHYGHNSCESKRLCVVMQCRFTILCAYYWKQLLLENAMGGCLIILVLCVCVCVFQVLGYTFLCVHIRTWSHPSGRVELPTITRFVLEKNCFWRILLELLCSKNPPRCIYSE